MHISKPTLQESDDSVRISVAMTRGERKDIIWYSVPRKWGDVLSTESSDGFLGVHFPLALISSLIMAVLCWGITLICLILGMKEADFSIKEPLDFALSYKGFLCLACEGIFTAVIIVLVGIPTTLFLIKEFSGAFFVSLFVSLLVTFIILKILYRLYASSLVELSRKEV